MAKNKAPAETAAVENKGVKFRIKKIFIDSCVYYTIMVLLLMTINLMLQTEDTRDVIFSADFLGLYPFSFLIACANLVLTNKKLPVWIKIGIHASCVLGGFAIYLATVKKADGNAILKISGALVAVYIVVMVAVVLILSLKTKSEKEQTAEEYKSVYGNITAAKAPQKPTNKNSPVADIEAEEKNENKDNKTDK